VMVLAPKKKGAPAPAKPAEKPRQQKAAKPPAVKIAAKPARA
jgi:hypothetical protein